MKKEDMPEGIKSQLQDLGKFFKGVNVSEVDNDLSSAKFKQNKEILEIVEEKDKGRSR